MKYKEIIKGIKSIMKIKFSDPIQKWAIISVVILGIVYLISKIL